MNIRDALMQGNNRPNMDRIASYAGSDRRRFDELMQLFLSDNYRVGQLAAWAVSICGETHPEWVRTYIPAMLDNLDKRVHPAVIRATMRLFQFVDIPKRYQGRVIDRCFTFLADPKAPIAIRVFSMTVLSNHTARYPELKQEMRVILEKQLPFAPRQLKAG